MAMPDRFAVFVAVALSAAIAGGAGEAQTTNQNDTATSSIHLSASDGGARRFEVAEGENIDLRQEPSTDAEIIETVHPGTLLSNLGCEATPRGTWCKVRTVRGRALGYVAQAGLLPAEGPDGVVPMGIDDSENRARKGQFDFTGNISCAQERGQVMGMCRMGVARSGGGDATAVVTFSNGFARRLHFTHGEFMFASATMSGSGRDTDWRLEGNAYFIRVDDQRYEVPRSLIVGD